MMPLPEDQRELLRKPLPRLYEKGVWATLRRGCSHQKECHVGRKEPSRRFLGLRHRRLRKFRTVSPRTQMNEVASSLVCRLTPDTRRPGPDDNGHPDGYELAYSLPRPDPHHHLPEEAPRLHTPVHVPLHVPSKWRVLSPFQVRVRYNQD